ncbi:hypothetical [Prochlorococcus marinus str. MIT 9313]|uniref:Uncharacterized protein n=1 Tax=Prochlorococcus marinus (strain MIT 9313) TaxID=74547 RepID=Q7V776_PROMM|nr:hypothetical [Prochlorococcus marinus str. MIT 9313]
MLHFYSLASLTTQEIPKHQLSVDRLDPGQPWECLALAINPCVYLIDPNHILYIVKASIFVKTKKKSVVSLANLALWIDITFPPAWHETPLLGETARSKNLLLGDVAAGWLRDSVFVCVESLTIKTSNMNFSSIEVNYLKAPQLH